MKSLILFPFFTIFTNPGYIWDVEENRKIFKLECKETECFYDLEFNHSGYYNYITENKKDTVHFLVEYLDGFVVHRTENSNYIFEIIK